MPEPPERTVVISEVTHTPGVPVKEYPDGLYQRGLRYHKAERV